MNSKSAPLLGTLCNALIAFICSAGIRCAPADDQLPRPDTPFTGTIAPSVDNSVPRWSAPVTAPQGAPNILIVLLDDVGFAAPELFGGAIRTPVLEKLATEGLRYNNFHVVGVCSSTRAALLAGRNHHRVGYGTTENNNGYPGYSTIWPKDAASIAEVLRQNGYSTAAFGKWHNTPVWEISPVGPFDRWPTGLGFEYFYGILRAQDSQWEPDLYLNTTPAEAPRNSTGYHFTSDIANRAIGWLHTHESLAPDRPYFLYVATAGTHAPHHVPRSYIDRYRDKFNQGWDRLRSETFARQKTLGFIPENTTSTPRPSKVPAWTSLSDGQRKLAARQMETFAGFLEHTDHEVGRVIEAVRNGPGAANTIIFYIAGDNGAPIGAADGSENLTVPRTLDERLRHLDALGGPAVDNDYAGGWGWATNSPFQGGKIKASHFGGTRNALVISWPKRITAKGQLRQQFTHVTDIMPTILEITGIQAPSSLNGVPQKSLDGVSLAYTFDSPGAEARHAVQYFEAFGSRAIYKDGWTACASHSPPWEGNYSSDYTRDRWELYNVAQDFSQAHDLADKHPGKLAALQAVFEREAWRNNVFPLGGAFLPSGADAPRPSLTAERQHFVFYPDSPRLPLTAVPVLARSHRITVHLDAPVGSQGVLVAQGSRVTGFVLYVSQGRLIYDNNFSGNRHDVITSSELLPGGKAEVAYEFKETKRSTSSGVISVHGIGRLYINRRLVGEGQISHVRDFGAETWRYFGAFGVGRSHISAVSDAEAASTVFTGKIEKVLVDLQPVAIPPRISKAD
ncbi:arylsulfatase [Steroidobacter agaridevorans]|uniref:Arylsulfatase n=1 Tax=Steroidobacter agaridevorans TaxID=2695856 RepID=A0A829YLK1_9GAMM|nr:arylsulfatase [Steroidobacter agaridevorans]GFE83712.1 arylsulfatase [Steroidobacter agaridevorans]